MCKWLCVWPSCVCVKVVCVTKFQSQRDQSESEHAVWWQLASHLTQPEHIAHCFVLTSSRTPGQRGDRRHRVGLHGTGTHAQWRTTKRCKVKATTATTKIGEHHAALWLRTSRTQLRNRQRQTRKQQLFQSRRGQSESEHAVWRQLVSHLTQPEHMAHCSVLASSFTPGQRGDRRHQVGLLGTGAHSNTWDEPELTHEAHANAAGRVIWGPPTGRCLGVLQISSRVPTIGMCPARRISPLPLPSYSVGNRALAPSTQDRVIPHPRPTMWRPTIRRSARYGNTCTVSDVQLNTVRWTKATRYRYHSDEVSIVCFRSVMDAFHFSVDREPRKWHCSTV